MYEHDDEDELLRRGRIGSDRLNHAAFEAQEGELAGCQRAPCACGADLRGNLPCFVPVRFVRLEAVRGFMTVVNNAA